VKWFTFAAPIRCYLIPVPSTEGSGVFMQIARLWACVLGLALLTVLPIAKASDETIRLAPGGGSELMLPASYDTVLIGNPDVVDVQRQTNRSALLKGLNPGASNIIFLDEQNVAIANIRVIVSDART
jgi:Flp pilus assembly secretin CpaC